MYDIKLKSKWQSYIRCMEQGRSINKIAKEIGINIQTSCDWRYKVLSSLSQYTSEKMFDHVECDELELALSNKGDKSLGRKPRKRGDDFKRSQGSDTATVVQVVTTVERRGSKYLKAVESKRLSKEEIQKLWMASLPITQR